MDEYEEKILVEEKYWNITLGREEKRNTITFIENFLLISLLEELMELPCAWNWRWKEELSGEHSLVEANGIITMCMELERRRRAVTFIEIFCWTVSWKS